MIEGWQGDDYLMLFDESESDEFAARYGLVAFFPGYRLVGLRGWDDLILIAPNGDLLTVPTVPMSHEFLEPLALSIDPGAIEPDERFRGKVKWYTKPIFLGGSPVDRANMEWVTIERHAELVKWWNTVCSGGA